MNTFGQGPQADNYINTTAVFGEVKRHILSNDFKVGNIANVFGKTVLNFGDAGINGAAVLDINQLFGEVIVMVPAGWHVIPEIANIFATVEDKRNNTVADMNNDKVLVLKGVGIFATVKIINTIN
jgi:hypothetical protein